MKISTKLHRLMWHLSDHVKNFGCRKRGNTDTNETLHKYTKRSYQATNKKLSEIASQILFARNIAQFYDNFYSSHSLYESLCDFSASNYIIEENTDLRYDFPEITQHQLEEIDSQIANLTQLTAGQSMDNIRGLVTSVTTGITNRKVWREVQSIRFNASYP